MRRNIIIVGGGRVGRHTAQGLQAARYKVTIIEQNGGKCESLGKHEVEAVIHGDGLAEENLEAADAAHADVVAALTNDTETNRGVAERVHDMNPDARKIVRIAHDGQQDLGHLSFIDNIVYPAAAGAKVAIEEISKR